jgi:hypothetical protein
MDAALIARFLDVFWRWEFRGRRILAVLVVG